MSEEPETADRVQPGSPLDRLARDPRAFAFLQAMRVLLADHRDRAGAPLDRDGDPAREGFRLSASQRTEFPGTELVGPSSARGAAREGGAETRRLDVAFLGLTGPSGALPDIYTETALRATRAKDTAFRDFLRVFDHRMIGLFFWASIKCRLPYVYEHHLGDGTDPISTTLMSLVGLGLPPLRDRESVADQTFVHYGGHYTRAAGSAAAIGAVLSDFFGQRIQVEQFRGSWLELPPEDRSALPSRLVPRGIACQLGVDAVAGTRVWDVQGGFRLVLGPLALRDFLEFIPGKPAQRALVALARRLAGPSLAFDVRLILRAEEVPACRLTPPGEGDGPLLGWTTWLKDAPFRHDARDAVFPGA